MSRPLLDHLVYTVPDLAAATAMFARALGVAPSFGGEHSAEYGTCNALLSLGEGQYLELLAPDPKAVALTEFARAIASRHEGDIISFAIASRDLAAVAARAAAVGLRTRPGAANSRVTPEGQLLRWQGLYLDSDHYRGLVPFYIDWLESTHPSATSARGTGLRDVFVTHPEPDGLRAIYRALEIGIPVRFGNRSSIVAVMESGDETVALIGSGCGLGL